MKQKFLKVWKSSRQPRKQRKYLANAPLHLRKEFLSVNLSKELRKSQGKRNVSLKKGDLVKIMRGEFKRKEGKVIQINTKTLKVYIEGIQVKKQDGSSANVSVHPSNLQIKELNLEKKRFPEKTKKDKVELKKKETENQEEKKTTEAKTEEKKEIKTQLNEKKKGKKKDVL